MLIFRIRQRDDMIVLFERCGTTIAILRYFETTPSPIQLRINHVVSGSLVELYIVE